MISTHVCLVCDPAEDGGDNGHVDEADSGSSACEAEVAVASLGHRCSNELECGNGAAKEQLEFEILRTLQLQKSRVRLDVCDFAVSLVVYNFA
jgi:hypothetical protein